VTRDDCARCEDAKCIDCATHSSSISPLIRSRKPMPRACRGPWRELVVALELALRQTLADRLFRSRAGRSPERLENSHAAVEHSSFMIASIATYNLSGPQSKPPPLCLRLRIARTIPHCANVEAHDRQHVMFGPPLRTGGGCLDLTQFGNCDGRRGVISGLAGEGVRRACDNDVPLPCCGATGRAGRAGPVAQRARKEAARPSTTSSFFFFEKGVQKANDKTSQAQSQTTRLRRSKRPMPLRGRKRCRPALNEQAEARERPAEQPRGSFVPMPTARRARLQAGENRSALRTMHAETVPASGLKR